MRNLVIYGLTKIQKLSATLCILHNKMTDSFRVFGEWCCRCCRCCRYRQHIGNTKKSNNDGAFKSFVTDVAEKLSKNYFLRKYRIAQKYILLFYTFLRNIGNIGNKQPKNAQKPNNDGKNSCCRCVADTGNIGNNGNISATAERRGRYEGRTVF